MLDKENGLLRVELSSPVMKLLGKIFCQWREKEDGIETVKEHKEEKGGRREREEAPMGLQSDLLCRKCPGG